MITADTNIYVYSADRRYPTKQAIAQRIVERLRGMDGPPALQLVGEFQNVLQRKLRAPPAYAAALGFELLTHHTMFANTEAAVVLALEETGRGRLSYWDALMLASAAEAGCTVMLSEDMQDGAVLFGLEIVNPFAAGGLSARAAELPALA